MGKLKPRKIIIGCDEQMEIVIITDQKMLRMIAEVEKLLPVRK